MVHRYGDVRSNYTDYTWYKFDDEYEFNELLYSVEKWNEVECKGKAYWCCTSLFDGYITVTPDNEEGQYCVYDYIETDEEMVKAIQEVYEKQNLVKTDLKQMKKQRKN